MARIVDEGDYFDAPIDKVWQLLELHSSKIGDIHPGITNPTIERLGENQRMIQFAVDRNGERVTVRIRTTSIPPLAQVVELLDGRLAGSKIVNYYTPIGEKTAVSVIADFVSSSLTGSELESAGRNFLSSGFEEDQAYLKRMR